MKRYLVSLHGRNLLFEMRGEKQKYGFRTKRYVTAGDAEEAEIKALKLIFHDRNLQGNIRNGSEDPPEIMAEEVEEIDRPAKEDYKDIKINYYRETPG